MLLHSNAQIGILSGYMLKDAQFYLETICFQLENNQKQRMPSFSLCNVDGQSIFDNKKLSKSIIKEEILKLKMLTSGQIISSLRSCHQLVHDIDPNRDMGIWHISDAVVDYLRERKIEVKNIGIISTEWGGDLSHWYRMQDYYPCKLVKYSLDMTYMLQTFEMELYINDIVIWAKNKKLDVVVLPYLYSYPDIFLFEEVKLVNASLVHCKMYTKNFAQ